MPSSPSSPPSAAFWQQTDRLATLGTLTAGVAHELNNPIGYILSNLTSFQLYLPIFQQYFQLLQDLADCQDEQQRQALQRQLLQLRQQENLQFLLEDTTSLLADSVTGALRMRDLLLDLRRFSHPDHVELQPLELTSLFAMALRLTRNEFKNHIEVTLSCDPQPLWVAGQPAALTQVLVNLLINAAQAIGPVAGQVQICVERRDSWLEIVIDDSGPGIPADVLPHIFTAFFTTKAPGKGTGLGLPICRSIAQQHQGELSVCPSMLGGAAFKLRLPVITAPAIDQV